MKSKFLLLFLSLFMVVGGVKAQSKSITIDGGELSSDKKSLSMTDEDGVCVTLSGGEITNNDPITLKVVNSGRALSFNKSLTYTISVNNGYVITGYSFSFTGTGGTYGAQTRVVGNGVTKNANQSESADFNSGTISSSTNTVTFTLAHNRTNDQTSKLTKFVVNIHKHKFVDAFCTECDQFDANSIVNNPLQQNTNMFLYYDDNGQQKALATELNMLNTDNPQEITFQGTTSVQVKSNEGKLNTSNNILIWNTKNSGISFYLAQVSNNGFKFLNNSKTPTRALGVKDGKLAYVDVADAVTFYLADTKANLSCKAKTADATAYGTFIAPFDVTLPSGVKAWKVTGVEHSVVGMEDACNGSNPLAANTAVVLENSGANAVGEWVYGISKGTQNQNSGSFLVGLYPDNLIVPVNAYVLQTPEGGKQMFYKMETAAEGVANRCYLAAGNYEVNAMSLSFDEVDAVEAVEALVSSKSQIYDITGRKLDRLQKGINIVNGKKILVK